MPSLLEERKKRKEKKQKKIWPDRMNNKRKKIIGLTGTNGAGKGEAASFFQKKGYLYFSLSDIIREKLREKGKKINRNNLIKTGNQLRERFGPDILARLVMRNVKGNSIIDSIRNPKEIQYLKRQKGFTLLAIDAPVELRYKRVKNRGREESASTLQEFVKKEAEEMTCDESGQQLHSCIKMADYIISNNSSLEEFHGKLEEFL